MLSRAGLRLNLNQAIHFHYRIFTGESVNCKLLLDLVPLQRYSNPNVSRRTSVRSYVEASESRPPYRSNFCPHLSRWCHYFQPFWFLKPHSETNSLESKTSLHIYPKSFYRTNNNRKTLALVLASFCFFLNHFCSINPKNTCCMSF